VLDFGLAKAIEPDVASSAKRSLERDVRRRQADIADARMELEEALTTPGSEVVPASPPRVALWRTLVLPAGIAVVAAALAGVVAWTMKPAVSRPVTRFSITLPADDEFSPVIATRTVVAVSPDGSRIAYVSSGPLHVRARDQLADVTIVGSGGSPFFSRAMVRLLG
jgi:hypothetical protein